MNSARKQRWQQATALVSLSTAGAMTGIAFAHGTLAEMTSPTSMPAHLLAFKKAASPASTGDGALRSAIVSAAKYYLRLAQGKTPAQMEALIWQDTSTDGADHGESCAAFASLALEAGAQATGQQSWVTGGTTYPWPLHGWADVRVDPNPQSPGIISMVQDAQAHNRWHPIGGGYTPQPGDWVLFAGHVEVVTSYSGGVLYTIGGDSMPNLSVNAHQYDDPLGAQGVTGFVNNGELLSAERAVPAAQASQPSSPGQPVNDLAERGQAIILGMAPPTGGTVAGTGAGTGAGTVAGMGAGVGAGQAASGSPDAPLADGPAVLGAAYIPGAPGGSGRGPSASASHRYGRSQPTPGAAQAPATATQQAFIQRVAPGAVAAQRQYGIPAAVTIAQAIDESGWGQSQLAAQDNNLFGIKGTGPAGSVMMATQEYQNGQWVSVSAPFRVYNSVTESIADHSLLLATGSSYKQAMADRQDPDAFANDLTGVYATDPSYGSNLITIMRLYNLYRYTAGPSPAAPHASSAPAGAGQAGGVAGGAGQGGSAGAQGGSALGGTEGATGGATALGALGGLGESPTAVSADLQRTAGLPADIPGVTGPSVAGPSVAASSTADPGTAGHARAGHGTRLARQHRGAEEPDESATRGAARSSARATAASMRTTTGSGTDGSVRQRAGVGAAAGSSALTQGAAGRGSSRQGVSAQVTSGRRTARAGAPRLGSSGGSTSGGSTSGLGTSGLGLAVPSNGSLGAAGGGAAVQGGARIPGLLSSYAGAASQGGGERALRAGPRNVRISTRQYRPQIPQAVTTAFITTAKTPLLRAEPLYRDVARDTGVRWQLLAACDWMQCQARPRISPVYGEKLGTVNRDGTVYRTKSQALEQCANDLITLAAQVYGIDLVERLCLSISDLAHVFAAFRWGGLLAAHHISAMEFPYSVEGLTSQHVRMRWPDIPEKPESDKPGARFAMAFGAVPVVLRLGYRAVA